MDRTHGIKLLNFVFIQPAIMMDFVSIQPTVADRNQVVAFPNPSKGGPNVSFMRLRLCQKGALDQFVNVDHAVLQTHS